MSRAKDQKVEPHEKRDGIFSLSGSAFTSHRLMFKAVPPAAAVTFTIWRSSMRKRLEGYPPANAEEVRVTALMNVLYYARLENLQGLLTWSRLLVRSGELSEESPEEVEQAIADVVVLSKDEEPPDRERLEAAFAAACRMMGLESR